MSGSFDEFARARVLVAERESFWLPELQRQFLGSTVEVHPASDLPAAGSSDRISQTHSTVTVIEARLLLETPRRWFATDADRDNRPVLAAILSRAEAPCEWALRELGVVAVVDEFIGGARLAAVCRRLLAAGSVPLTPVR